MSQDHNHLDHATWEFNYYVSSRRSAARWRYWGKTGGTWTLNSPAQESRIEEGHPTSDHVQVDQMQTVMTSRLSSQNPL
jgi:hypothetical protein